AARRNYCRDGGGERQRLALVRSLSGKSAETLSRGREQGEGRRLLQAEHRSWAALILGLPSPVTGSPSPSPGRRRARPLTQGEVTIARQDRRHEKETPGCGASAARASPEKWDVPAFPEPIGPWSRKRGGHPAACGGLGTSPNVRRTGARVAPIPSW